MSRKRLSFRERRRGYRLARRSWMLAGGNRQRAEKEFKAQARAEGIDPATLALLFRLALLLFDWWLSKGIQSPPAEPDESSLSIGAEL